MTPLPPKNRIVHVEVLGRNKVELISHAVKQMKIRVVTEKEVIHTLKNYEEEIPI